MIKLPAPVWAQLKNLTADRLCTALEKDGWALDMAGGSGRVYRHHDGGDGYIATSLSTTTQARRLVLGC